MVDHQEAAVADLAHHEVAAGEDHHAVAADGIQAVDTKGVTIKVTTKVAGTQDGVDAEADGLLAAAVAAGEDPHVEAREAADLEAEDVAAHLEAVDEDADDLRHINTVAHVEKNFTPVFSFSPLLLFPFIP